MPKVSVIVPAYNVEKYLRKSMNCILNQTFSDFEVILIDDGSNDSTPAICDELSRSDSRVKCFHKSNGGVSAARNYGLDRITGKYMTFIDSDDMVTEDYLETLLQLLENSSNAQISMVNGKAVLENEKTIPEKENEILNVTVEQAVQMMLLRKKYTHANWGKLYKSELWENIRFPENIVYDDYDTTYRVYAGAQRVVCADCVKYFYVQREGSLMHAKCSERTLSVLDVADDITAFMIKTWPDSKIYAIDMQIATYMKNMQAILNTGMDAYPESQNRIVTLVKRNAKDLILSSFIPRNDKIKIMALLISKKFFLKLYNRHDGDIAI